MKIGMVAPLIESCPPKLYGGTERVVANLCNGLADLGHEVTLFASGDSKTKANLIPVVPKSLRIDHKNNLDFSDIEAKQLNIVKNLAKEKGLDIIHNHIGNRAFPNIPLTNCPWVSTMHGRLDLNSTIKSYGRFPNAALISISYTQRKPLPNNNWEANIYHGIDVKNFKPKFIPGKYLAFLGRISPEKGIERAIKIANLSGVPLKIAAKIDDYDREYYENIIKPLIDGKQIEFIGEISEQEKSEFLSNALALLFPINWPEPFGLVVIEAYACGTPVLTTPWGSMPEIIRAGKTGHIAFSDAQFIKYINEIDRLSRRYIRKYAETHHSIESMVKNHITLFEKLAINSIKSFKADLIQYNTIKPKLQIPHNEPIPDLKHVKIA